MNILLTGSSGFIGKSLLMHFLNNGHKVLCINRGNLVREIINENLGYISEMELKLHLEPIDILVYSSWGGTRGEDRNNEQIQLENLYFLSRILRQAERLNVKTILSFGSQAEYGYVQDIINEQNFNPVSYYGVYKIKAKEQMREFCAKRGIRFIWLRLFSVYGYGDYANTLVSMTVTKMLKDESLDLTECIHSWDFLYIKDLIYLVDIFIHNDQLSGEFNVANGKSKKLKEFIEIIRYVTNSRSLVNYGAVKYPESGYTSLNVDITKLVQLTGWKPIVSFEEGILQTVEDLTKGTK